MTAFVLAIQHGVIAIDHRIHGVSRSTLYRWKRRYQQAGMSGLHDQYGPKRRGSRRLPQAQQHYLVTLIMQSTPMTVRAMERAVVTRFGRDAVPHYQTIRRFVQAQRHGGEAK